MIAGRDWKGFLEMRKLFLMRFLFVILVILAAFFLSPFSVTVQAATANQHNSANATCQKSEVVLQGKKTPNISCLDGSLSTNVQNAPYITDTYHTNLNPTLSVVGCPNSSALVLYWNGPINVSAGIIPSGPELCITGEGTLNLAAQTINGLNWNDQASAFWAGCVGGNFYVNNNYYNPMAAYPAGVGNAAPAYNFPYTDYDELPGDPNWTIPNDALTMIDAGTYSDC